MGARRRRWGANGRWACWRRKRWEVATSEGGTSGGPLRGRPRRRFQGRGRWRCPPDGNASRWNALGRSSPRLLGPWLSGIWIRFWRVWLGVGLGLWSGLLRLWLGSALLLPTLLHISTCNYRAPGAASVYTASRYRTAHVGARITIQLLVLLREPGGLLSRG